MAIEALYGKIRAQIRNLARRDSLAVIWAYSKYLQVNDFRLPRNIEIGQQLRDANPKQAVLAEWTLEHLAREVIRYADEEAHKGATLRQWGTLAGVANAFRDLEGEIYRDLVGGPNIHLELMRIMHRQFVWQQQRFDWPWIIRYYKIFNTPELGTHAEAATGLTIGQIYLIGLAYLGHFFDQPRWTKKVTVEIPGLTAEHLERFLAFTCRPRAALAEKLRKEHVLDEGFAYRYSSLREFPIVEYSHGGIDEIACPIPTLLFWRITTGLYYSLRGESGFPTAFGASFQAYVGEVLQHRITAPSMTILPETEYHAGLNRKDSMDWIVTDGETAALFIECKTMRLTWASKAGMADLTMLAQDVRKLAGAVIQTYKAIRDYRAGLYPHLAYLEARHVTPVVVTLEDWYCHGQYLPALLDEAVRAAMENAGLPVEWLADMPYAVISIDEFETAVGVTNSAGIDTFWRGKLLDADKRRWPYRSYCGDDFADAVAELPDLFHDEFEAMFVQVGD